MATFALTAISVLITFGKLIDGVVSQMHEEVVHIVGCRPFVGFGTKASECHLVQVYSHGRNAVKKYV